MYRNVIRPILLVLLMFFSFTAVPCSADATTGSEMVSAFPDFVYSLLFFLLFSFVYIVILRQNKLSHLKSIPLSGLLCLILLAGACVRLFLLYKISGAITKEDLFPVIADLLTSFIVYRFGVKSLGSGAALGIGLLFAVNPAAIFHATVWGQASSYFICAVVVLLYALSSWKRLVITIAGGLVCYGIAVLKGSNTLLAFKPWAWVGAVIHHVFVSDNSATLNAFNLFALTGGNGFTGSDTRMLLSYNVWGCILVAAALIFIGFFLYRKRAEITFSLIVFTLLLLTVSVFVLAPHIRISYLYPAVPLALISYTLTKDRRLLQLFIGFSLTHFINASHVFSYSKTATPSLPHVEGILMVMSLANVVLLIYLVYVGIDIYMKKRVLLMRSTEDEVILHSSLSHETRMRLTTRDWLIMSVITFVYAIVAFYNLGSMKSPETSWKPVNKGSFYIDLGESRTIDRINVLSGIGEGKFTLEFGADATDKWESPKTMETDYTKVYKWMTQTVNLSARYVKFTIDSPGFTLNELAIYDKYDNPEIPKKIVAVHSEALLPEDQAHLDNLFDEQSAAVYKQSFMNETYFDEIYHARTAFEHLHLIKPYETTHPPLGKLLIVIGIKLFGMDPFGWRVVGTVFGIGMLPMMYVFAKRLFGKTEYAFFSAFLMACDFMHFAQTRIATIDVYGVFFIILMYYFMLRFYQLNFYQIKLWAALRPLFLSGLFFGIGAASKWIVIYGGAGLALIFVITLYDRYKEYEAAKRLLSKAEAGEEQTLVGAVETLEQSEAAEPAAIEEALTHESYAQQIVKAFPKLTAKIVGWCSVFFIIIPAIIYSLSFFPIMAVPGEKHTVTQLVQYQKDMFDYHSKLVATHPFSSAWWEWPLIMRPIWYYSGHEVSDGNVSSIASFGNPAIWWLGLFAVIAAIFVSRQRKDKAMFVVLVAYFSQYVPWMLVSRLTFIYHYFAMVPFLILCIVYLLKVIIEMKPFWRKFVYGYLTLVFGLFVMFYPVLSGMVVNRNYVDNVLRWFYSWTF